MEAYRDLVDVLRNEMRELEEMRRTDDEGRAAEMLDREIEEHRIEILALGGDPDE